MIIMIIVVVVAIALLASQLNKKPTHTPSGKQPVQPTPPPSAPASVPPFVKAVADDFGEAMTLVTTNKFHNGGSAAVMFGDVDNSTDSFIEVCIDIDFDHPDISEVYRLGELLRDRKTLSDAELTENGKEIMKLFGTKSQPRMDFVRRWMKNGNMYNHGSENGIFSIGMALHKTYPVSSKTYRDALIQSLRAVNPHVNLAIDVENGITTVEYNYRNE